MRRDLPRSSGQHQDVWWSQPYHHAVLAPGQFLVPLPGSDATVRCQMVWYATNRRPLTVRYKGKNQLALIGVYGLFSHKEPAKPVKLDYRALPATDLLTIGFGKLHLLMRWPSERFFQPVPVTHIVKAPLPLLGYIVDGKVRPFTILEMHTRLSWEQIEALHEGCRHGHWFMWGTHAYFTDERSAVYARLLAGDVLR
jgi:hypothetical protein